MAQPASNWTQIPPKHNEPYPIIYQEAHSNGTTTVKYIKSEPSKIYVLVRVIMDVSPIGPFKILNQSVEISPLSGTFIPHIGNDMAQFPENLKQLIQEIVSPVVKECLKKISIP